MTATAMCDLERRMEAIERRIRAVENVQRHTTGYALVIAVPCPWCGAETGQSCREPSDTATRPHKARARAYHAMREMQAHRG